MTIRQLNKLIARPPEPGENMAVYHGNHAVWHSDKAVIYSNRALYWGYTALGLSLLSMVVRFFC